MKPYNEKAALRAILMICRRVALKPVQFRLHDGHDWVHAEPIFNGEQIVRDANSTGTDTLAVYNPITGNQLGRFVLVWGNAQDGEELISDYYINDFTDTVWDRFQALYGN
jgi:hypothetical protein